MIHLTIFVAGCNEVEDPAVKHNRYVWHLERTFVDMHATTVYQPVKEVRYALVRVRVHHNFEGLVCAGGRCKRRDFLVAGRWQKQLMILLKWCQNAVL